MYFDCPTRPHHGSSSKPHHGPPKAMPPGSRRQRLFRDCMFPVPASSQQVTYASTVRIRQLPVKDCIYPDILCMYNRHSSSRSSTTGSADSGMAYYNGRSKRLTCITSQFHAWVSRWHSRVRKLSPSNLHEFENDFPHWRIFAENILLRVSTQKSLHVGNHLHSCNYTGILFVLASITVKPRHGTRGNTPPSYIVTNTPFFPTLVGRTLSNRSV